MQILHMGYKFVPIELKCIVKQCSYEDTLVDPSLITLKGEETSIDTVWRKDFSQLSV